MDSSILKIMVQLGDCNGLVNQPSSIYSPPKLLPGFARATQQWVDASWNLLVVYASPRENGKNDLWKELAMTAANAEAGQILGGDFNEIKDKVDKHGGVPTRISVVPYFMSDKMFASFLIWVLQGRNLPGVVPLVVEICVFLRDQIGFFAMIFEGCNFQMPLSGSLLILLF